MVAGLGSLSTLRGLGRLTLPPMKRTAIPPCSLSPGCAHLEINHKNIFLNEKEKKKKNQAKGSKRRIPTHVHTSDVNRAPKVSATSLHTLAIMDRTSVADSILGTAAGPKAIECDSRALYAR